MYASSTRPSEAIPSASAAMAARTGAHLGARVAIARPASSSTIAAIHHPRGDPKRARAVATGASARSQPAGSTTTTITPAAPRARTTARAPSAPPEHRHRTVDDAGGENPNAPWRERTSCSAAQRSTTAARSSPSSTAAATGPGRRIPALEPTPSRVPSHATAQLRSTIWSGSLPSTSTPLRGEGDIRSGTEPSAARDRARAPESVA